MTRKTLQALGLVLTAFAGAPLAAQIDGLITLTDTPTGNDIVVTHAPDPVPESASVQEQLGKIAETGSHFNEPVAIFQEKLCPGVMGLPVDIAETIVGRVRYNAERLGVPLAKKEGCKANLVIGFVGSGRSDVQKLDKQTGGLLSELKPDERRALVNDTGPVHAWTVTSTRTRDGAYIHGDDRYGLTQTVNVQSGNSLFLLATREDIELSVVLMDIPAIDGMTVNQLADYATMRGLAKTKGVSGNNAYGTILNLFDPDASHQTELSNFDRAYLTAIYSNMPNVVAAAKFAAVPGLMKKQLAADEDRP
ncbi:MAG: hypothetical protein P0Y56_13770 [Candidatus Andeanibacterium colombiense]|uniref:Uncharacterized protein n=1 Tax=Candidatus Andeanibacterium colombiense TaxID=3121345 RepID=A0AAJ5X599_9SPHN|nr:MAG: hypothetical protein P0Y56_13770 [Sphingomonadaceae bacterium]